MLWHLKQLIPLTYRSHYMVGDKKQFSVWKMWLGKVYNHDCVTVVQKGLTMTKKHLKFTGHKSGSHKTFIDFGYHWKAGDIQEVDSVVAEDAVAIFPELFTITEKPKESPVEPLKKINPPQDKSLKKDDTKDKDLKKDK